MTKQSASLTLMFGLSGCVPTDEIAFDVEADVSFTHEESVDPLLEGFDFTETDVPDGLQIAVGEHEQIVFEGILTAGEHTFQMDFEHYGDVSRTKRSRWLVTVLAK